MDKAHLIRTAKAFHALHKDSLLLPNAWDAMSARIFVAAGFPAVATTSGGLAWALGYPDGEAAPFEEVAAAVRRIVRVARVPVSVDLEAGYGDDPAGVGFSVREMVRAGAVGVNIEDGVHGASSPIRGVADAVARLKAARAAGEGEGVPILLNGRSDLYHYQVGDEKSRFEETVARGKAYLAAGADCFYPFGLRDPATIGRLCQALDAPINVTGRPGMPDAAALFRLGVRRITIAGAPSLVTMAAIQKIATELKATGGFEMLTAPLRHPDAQKLFTME